MDNSAHRWFYDSTDLLAKKSVFANWIFFALSTSILGCILIVPFSTYISIQLFQNPDQSWIVIICAINLLFSFLPNVLSNWYRVNLDSFKTMIFASLNSICIILLNVILVLYCKLGIIGFFISNLITSIIFTIVAIIELRDIIQVKFIRLDTLKQMIWFAMPVVPAAVSFWVINNTDSYFILYYLDENAVGLFSIGVTFSTIINFFTNSYQQAFGPYAYSIINNTDAKDIYAKILKIFTNTKFYEAKWVLSILSVNVLIIGYSNIASLGISIVKNNKYYFYAMFYAMILTIVFNLLLIPRMGINGSALATLLANLLVPIYLFYYSQKHYPVQYPFKQSLFLITISWVMGICMRLVLIDDHYYLHWVKALVSILFTVIFVYFIIKNLKEIKLYR